MTDEDSAARLLVAEYEDELALSSRLAVLLDEKEADSRAETNSNTPSMPSLSAPRRMETVQDFFAQDTLGFASDSAVESAGPGRLTISRFVPTATVLANTTLGFGIILGLGAIVGLFVWLLLAWGAWLWPAVLGLACTYAIWSALRYAARRAAAWSRMANTRVSSTAQPVLTGSELIREKRLPFEKRVTTVVKMEQACTRTDDYAPLSMAVATLLEGWLGYALQAESSALTTQLFARKDPSNTADLAEIVCSPDRMTLGVLAIYVRALERAVRKRKRLAHDFVGSRFPGALHLFESARLSRLLFQLRDERNALAHGRAAAWSIQDHQALCMAALGFASVRDWLTKAPSSSPAVQLLTHLRNREPADGAT